MKIKNPVLLYVAGACFLGYFLLSGERRRIEKIEEKEAEESASWYNPFSWF